MITFWEESDLINFIDWVESKPLRRQGTRWVRVTNDPSDEPLNFTSISSKELIEWFKKENK